MHTFTVGFVVEKLFKSFILTLHYIVSETLRSARTTVYKRWIRTIVKKWYFNFCLPHMDLNYKHYNRSFGYGVDIWFVSCDCCRIHANSGFSKNLSQLEKNRKGNSSRNIFCWCFPYRQWRWKDETTKAKYTEPETKRSIELILYILWFAISSYMHS